MDPHTLQQILDRISQQVRCPQCGKEVPMDFKNVKVIAEGAMLLQLRCEHCNAYIVLQASLRGVEQISAPPYEVDECANVSTGISSHIDDVERVRQALGESGGSFNVIFKTKENRADMEIA